MLNWARRTSWGWWDDWDDTVLQTQDSKFEPWRSEAEHATSRSRRLPTILTFTRGWGRNNFVSFKPPRPGTEPRTLAWKAAVLTTTLGPPPYYFETCSNGLMYTNECQEGLEFDQDEDRCVAAPSSTCCKYIRLYYIGYKCNQCWLNVAVAFPGVFIYIWKVNLEPGL